MASTGPLDGIRILEIGGGIAGPLCTRLLAQYGAEVVKIEPPGTGDPLRHLGPFVGHEPHPEKSVSSLYLNTNKLSVTLDLSTRRGAGILRDLVRDAAIVVESTKPGTLAAWGLGWEQLEAVNPDLVLTSVTPFGQDGPYRDYDATEIVLTALAGIMAQSGLYDREPLKHGHPQSQFIGGLQAAGASMVAFFNVLCGGGGQQVDMSLQAGVSHELIYGSTFYTYQGATLGRAPNNGGSGQNGSGNDFGGITPLAGGYVGTDAPPDGRWAELADFLGVPELRDERFSTRTGRALYAAELNALVLPALQRTSHWEYFHHAQRNGWSAGIVQTMSDLAACPQLDARGFWAELDHPIAGRLRYPADFARMSATPGRLTSAAPLLGQHNQTVYGEWLGYSAGDLEALRSQGVI